MPAVERLHPGLPSGVIIMPGAEIYVMRNYFYSFPSRDQNHLHSALMTT